MKRIVSFLAVLLAISLVYGFAAVGKADQGGPAGPVFRQALMERLPGMFDPVSYVKEQQERYDRLMAEAAPLSSDSLITIRVSQEDLDGIADYECDSCGGVRSSARKMRIGVVKPVEVAVGFRPLTAGTLSRTADGGFAWTMALESPGATALRVHFGDVSLPANAELYIYNISGEAFGPYTGTGPGNRGDFWSHTVSGPVVYVQLRHFGPASDSDLEAAGFVVRNIGYLGEKFLLPYLRQLREYSENISRTGAFCSFNAPCIEDASCYSGSALDNARYAVAHMEWVEMPWLYYCSGGLIADTDPGTQIPYFLTANHCVNTDSVAGTVEFYWQFLTSSCGGACYDPLGAVPRTIGADVLSTGATGDYTLMQLAETPPAGSYMMGWTSAPVAFANGADLFRVSHPQGAPQAYSTHEVDTSAPTCGSWPRGSWVYSRDVIGATEGGSSGSPVYNMSGQIVGQLSGACGYYPEDACDNINNATVDGAFASYFSAVQQWLDPPSGGDTVHVAWINAGIRVNGAKYDAGAAVKVVDENGGPVQGATVTGTLSSGDKSVQQTGVTNSNGVAYVYVTIASPPAAFNFCMDGITHASYTYDPAANLENCETYSN